jgi:putative transposase
MRAHRDVSVGMDFFTTEVLTLKGLTTYDVLFFIDLKSRQGETGRIHAVPGSGVDGAAGARNITMEEWGISERLPLAVAGPRYEVLCVIS